MSWGGLPGTITGPDTRELLRAAVRGNAEGCPVERSGAARLRQRC
ncbi:hypothetical protein [Streptomyces vinaceus]